MEHPETTQNPDRFAMLCTAPSILLVIVYFFVFVLTDNKILSCVPLLFLGAPVLLFAFIMGVPAIHHSNCGNSIRLLLYFCHALAAVVVLMPVLIVAFILITRGGLTSA